MAGYVYLIGSRPYNWFKIGKSKNAAVRVADIGILLPFRIEVLAVWHTLNHHELEKQLHEKLRDYRINGEWFSLNVQQVNELIRDLAIMQAPVAANFSNIRREADTNWQRFAEKTIAGAHVARRSARGGIKNRFDDLTKINAELKEEIKELKKILDSQKLPTI